MTGMTAREGHGSHDRGAPDAIVQLGFDGAEAIHKLRPFREAMRRPGIRQVPVSALQDVCALGYADIADELLPEHLPRADEFSGKLTAVLVRAETFQVIANWAKVRRAQAAGQQHIEIVDIICDDGDEWWALLAEIREMCGLISCWSSRWKSGRRDYPVGAVAICDARRR